MVDPRLVVRIACALAAGAVAFACAHRPPPTLRSTRLVVMRTADGGFVPFVRAKVAGQPMMLVLDTGAIRNILPEGFARAHKLPRRSMGSAERYMDANGNVAWMPYLPNVPVQFEGEPTGGTLDFVMNPSAETTGGILAPQSLVQPGWAMVIDLGREELRYEQEAIALKRVGEESSSPLLQLDFHRCLAEGFFERSHRIVSTVINGVSAEMLVDTGSSRTALARNNPAIDSMLAREGKRGTATGLHSTGHSLLLDDVPIVVSQTSFVVPVIVLPASQICGRGFLGTDVLRHCTLVWGYSSLWASCRSPSEGPSQTRN